MLLFTKLNATNWTSLARLEWMLLRLLSCLAGPHAYFAFPCPGTAWLRVCVCVCSTLCG